MGDADVPTMLRSLGAQTAARDRSLSYRPAIDGLRAIAVAAVFVFHINRAWLPGGFIGVDVFFVISGYLISSILLLELRSGELSGARFYQRRIARLLPTFFTVALATLFAASAVYSAQDFSSTGANLVAAALSVVNLKVMLQGSYFQLSPDAQPLLHYWSLAVEEQFYMVFPWLLWLLRRQGGNRRFVILGSIAVASFATCLFFTWWRPVWAFFLLPTRAWELLTGAVLASAVFARPNREFASLPAWVPAAGLAALLGSAFVVDEAGFPGYQALAAVLGTAVVLWPVSVGGSLSTERLLSQPALVWLGKRSYSLYLWHWPVFSMVDYGLFLWSPLARIALKIGASALLTWVCFRYIENPARMYLGSPAKRRVAMAALALCVLASVLLGVGVRRTRYIEASGGERHFNASGSRGSVMLMGDSNASMYGTALLDLAVTADWKLSVISVDAGDPLPTLDGARTPLWEYSLNAVERTRPDLLVLVCAWKNKLAGSSARLAAAIRELRPHVGRLVLFTEPPNRPDAASRASLRRGIRGPFVDVPELRETRRASNAMVLELQDSGIMVLDIEDLFLEQQGTVRAFDREGRELFQDASHLSERGARLVISRLRAVLNKVGMRAAAEVGGAKN